MGASMLRMALPLLGSILIAACGGGGGGGDSGGGSSATVTISGKITFDRVPFKPTVGTGLDFAGIIESPARNVVVEAVQPGNVVGGETIVASTTTDAAGDYSLQVPGNTNVLIRAKAQMLKTGTAPTWNFRVLNNTGADALYTLDGTAASSGNASSTRNLRATSGWGTTSYTGTRAAAPFAILDTLYQVKSLILSAKGDTAFPALDLYWSTQNRASQTLCPDTGDIVTSLYVVFAPNETDQCTTPTPGRTGIYILGSFTGGDTDEFDQHVIAHEAGHYFEGQFSRSDSIGGEHSLQNKLDLRVAFGEGWGDAFGAMALNDPVYRDSYSGANLDSGFNLEMGTIPSPGWFSEFSTFHFLWDIFDAANEPADTVALGFGPIYNVMVSAQSGTDALTSIFPFARALKANIPSAATGINALLADQGISAIADDFGSTETVFAGGPNVVPIYTTIASGPPISICGSAAYGGEYNMISNRRFLVFQTNSARSITVTATVTSSGPGAAADPDILVWSRGSIVALGELCRESGSSSCHGTGRHLRY